MYLRVCMHKLPVELSHRHVLVVAQNWLQCFPLQQAGRLLHRANMDLSIWGNFLFSKMFHKFEKLLITFSYWHDWSWVQWCKSVYQVVFEDMPSLADWQHPRWSPCRCNKFGSFTSCAFTSCVFNFPATEICDATDWGFIGKLLSSQRCVGSIMH